MSKKTLSFEEAKIIATQYCTKAEKCQSDVIKKLNQFSLTPSDIKRIVDYLEKEKFIDELRYAKAFANDKLKLNQWGKNKIVLGLKAKKINPHIISKAIEELDEELYLAILKKILLKKNKTLSNDLNDYDRKHKLFQFAYMKGFEWEEIERVLLTIL